MKPITIACVVLLTVSGAGSAYGQPPGIERPAISPARHAKLVGCLQKPDAASGFVLKNARIRDRGEMGDVELTGVSPSLELDKHVGHEVEVEGQLVGVHEPQKFQADKRARTAEGALGEETGNERARRPFSVISVKHLSPKCP